MQRSFPETLSALRRDKNISQRKAAADLNISQALLSHYENGAREPGLEGLERRGAIQSAIAPFEVVEIDARIASAAADIRHRRQMKLMDALILATAQVNGSILVTRNTKDFPAEMPGIRVPYTL